MKRSQDSQTNTSLSFLLVFSIWSLCDPGEAFFTRLSVGGTDSANCFFTGALIKNIFNLANIIPGQKGSHVLVIALVWLWQIKWVEEMENWRNCLHRADYRIIHRLISAGGTTVFISVGAKQSLQDEENYCFNNTALLGWFCHWWQNMIVYTKLGNFLLGTVY